MKTTYTVDLDGKKRKCAIMRRFAAAVPVPPHFGRNLDALYDVLTEYGAEWKIEFKNSANAPEAFRQVCEDAVAETPGLEIEWR